MRKPLCLIMIVLLLTAVSPAASALDVESALITPSQYFSIRGPADMNVIDVLAKLNYNYFLQVDSLLNGKESEPKIILAHTLDAMFLESCRILGIHVYSFTATLEFLADQNAVKIVIKNLSGIDVDERAFYLYDLKTIYISLADLSVGVLGHEMAHAIISHYFGAPPSDNIQEILAGYVDYSLRKSTGALE